MRAYRGVTCGSDNYIVGAKIASPFKHKETRNDQKNPEETKTVTTKQYNLDSLIHESTRILYQNRLDERLADSTDEKSVEKIYKNVTNSLTKAAEEALGMKLKPTAKNCGGTAKQKF